MTEHNPTLVEAFALVEDALRAHHVVAVTFADDDDEYDCEGIVQLLTYERSYDLDQDGEGDRPVEHAPAGTLLAAYLAAGGAL